MHAVGDALVADAAEAPQILLGLFLDHLDHVVDRHDADQALVGVDDGRRFEVVALELARHLLLVGRRQHDLAVGVHDLLDRHLALGAQQPAEVDDCRSRGSVGSTT